MSRGGWKEFLLERVKASRQDGSAPPKALTLLQSLSPAWGVEWEVPTRDGDKLAPTQPGLSHTYGVT